MKAIVLLSGGLDSTVILAKALSDNRECLAISFDYGQRHKVELESAKAVAKYYHVPHKIISIDPSAFGLSALVGEVTLQKNRSVETIKNSGTPASYVPARNTIFLSFALAHAENFSAEEIYVGPNAMDTIYPDCSKNFLDAFQGVINVATKQSIEGRAPRIIAPLIEMNKKQIIALGKSLNAPLELSFSCYDPVGDKPCLQCDACTLRADGFKM